MNEPVLEPLPLPPDCIAAKSAFFLDIDGTLLDIASNPDSVIVDMEIVELVNALHALSNGALALVSGRSLTGVDWLMGIAGLPAAGQHGAERRNAQGKVRYYATSKAALSRARAVIAEWLQPFPQVLVEDKSLSVAIHYRHAPELARRIEAMLRKLVAAFPDLDLQPGKMVFEVRPAGLDKGFAIREFMIEPPFKGRQAIFVGDDVTDEFGFAEVNAIGGLSIKVGMEPTVARFRLPDVAAVRRWIKHLIHNAGKAP